MSMKTIIQNFAKELKVSMHTYESFFDLLSRYLPKFEESASADGSNSDKLADITTTAKTWTPDDKYKYYLIVINVSGYVETYYLPKDKVGSPVIVDCYLNDDYHAGFNVDTSATGLKYTASIKGFGSVQSAEIRGIY